MPTDVAVLVVLWRLQDKLSLRNVAEMVLTRGFSRTHETAPAWVERRAPLSEQRRLFGGPLGRRVRAAPGGLTEARVISPCPPSVAAPVCTET